MSLMSSNATYGERLINKLLGTLPEDEVFYISEPRIRAYDGKTHKPDFIIVLRQHGVITLEVKDWRQIIEGTQKTVTIIRQKDQEVLVEPSPILIAEQYAHHLNKLFEDRKEINSLYRGKRRLNFPWQPMVALPNISNDIIQQFEAKGIWDRGVVLGRETLANPTLFQKALKNLPWRWSLKQPLDYATLAVIREIIDPILILERHGEHIGTLTQLQETLIKEPLPSLEPQQATLLEAEPPHPANKVGHSVRLVRGVAGSGKTLVLIKRAAYLKKCYPEANILVLAFNKDLAPFLQQQLAEAYAQQEVAATPDEAGIAVTNFHKLCVAIIGKQHIKEPTPWLQKHHSQQILAADLTVEFIEEEIKWRKEMELFDDEAYLGMERKGRGTALLTDKRRLVNDIFRKYLHYQQQNNQQIDWEDVPLYAYKTLETPGHPLRHTYDAILVDEAQDFAPTWLKVVNLLLKPTGSLFLCDDPTQSIFRSYSWREKGVEVVGRTRVFQVPFRCTRQISEAAHSLIKSDQTLNKDEEVTQPNLRPSYLREGEKPLLIQCADQQHQLDLLIQELSENGILPHEIGVLYPHYVEQSPWYQPEKHDGIYISYFNKMKGLEFKAVIIPQLETLFSKDHSEGDISKVHRRIFTAMTRARDFLALLYTGELAKPLEPLLPYVRHQKA